jgi:hypothetical protein
MIPFLKLIVVPKDQRQDSHLFLQNLRVGRDGDAPSPGKEMSQVALISPPCVLGFCGGNELENLGIGTVLE